MITGDRIRAIRERKQLSQVELAVRAGLVRSYISGVENGYIVPSVESLEKIARVFDIPLHRLFYDGDEPPLLTNLPNRLTADDVSLDAPDGDSHCFIKFGQRLDSFGDTRRSIPLTDTHGISVCLSKPYPAETRHSFGHRNSRKNLMRNGLGAANKS
jgi:transcriptional regulator with XRE-family HTH domain